MDKEFQRNLLLAFLLSGAIILLWNIFFFPKTPSRPVSQKPVKREEVKPAIEEVVREVPEAEIVDIEEMLLENPKVEAIFTTLGARLKSLKLKQYKSQMDTDSVDLVPPSPDKLRYLPLSLEVFLGERGSVRDSDFNFDFRREGEKLIFSREIEPNLRLQKAFSLRAEGYLMDMEIIFENLGNTAIQLGESEGIGYALNWEPGVESPPENKRNLLKAMAVVGGRLSEKDAHKVKNHERFPPNLDWIGAKSKYFFIALKPQSPILEGGIESIKSGQLRVSLLMEPLKIEPQSSHTHHFLVAGAPLAQEVLKDLGEEFTPALNFGFLDSICKFMLYILKVLYKVSHNYGLAIILLTLLARLILYPLNQKQYESMKKMQQLQPKINELREKYKADPKEMQKSMMELYKTQKVNPMGGCWPLFMQMPIFISLYQTLNYAVELRGASFLWAKDLSRPDTVFTLPFSLPFFGNAINILPLFMIGSFILQQKLTPSQAADQSQQRLMSLMPIFFGLLFYQMPSGLVLYILVSTLLGLAQQVLTTHWHSKRAQHLPAHG